MTHSNVRHDSFTCAMWRIHTWRVTRDSFVRATWLIHVWDMTHSHARDESFICNTWLMVHSYVRHDSFTCEKWLIHMCDIDMPHSRVGSDSFIRDMKARTCRTLLWGPLLWCICICKNVYIPIYMYIFISVDKSCLIRYIAKSSVIYMCNMAYSYMDTTHSHACHDSFMCDMDTRTRRVLLWGPLSWWRAAVRGLYDVARR